MASPKDKNEEEILERIAALYGQLDDIRDQRREVHTVGTEDGPRAVERLDDAGTARRPQPVARPPHLIFLITILTH